jgi:hypothetical protein
LSFEFWVLGFGFWVLGFEFQRIAREKTRKEEGKGMFDKLRLPAMLEELQATTLQSVSHRLPENDSMAL